MIALESRNALRPRDPVIVALETQNARLRAEVTELRRLLDLDSDSPAMVALGFTKMQAIILHMILRRELASKDVIYARLYGLMPDADAPDPKVIDIVICRIRKLLRVHGIDIKTRWGQGYFFLPSDKAKLRSLLGGAQ